MFSGHPVNGLYLHKLRKLVASQRVCLITFAIIYTLIVIKVRNLSNFAGPMARWAAGPGGSKGPFGGVEGPPRRVDGSSGPKDPPPHILNNYLQIWTYMDTF